MDNIEVRLKAISNDDGSKSLLGLLKCGTTSTNFWDNGLRDSLHGFEDLVDHELNHKTAQYNITVHVPTKEPTPTADLETEAYHPDVDVYFLAQLVDDMKKKLGIEPPLPIPEWLGVRLGGVWP